MSTPRSPELPPGVVSSDLVTVGGPFGAANRIQRSTGRIGLIVMTVVAPSGLLLSLHDILYRKSFIRGEFICSRPGTKYLW